MKNEFEKIVTGPFLEPEICTCKHQRYYHTEDEECQWYTKYRDDKGKLVLKICNCAHYETKIVTK